MITNSYLEYFLTLLGWVINNGLWVILTDTGLFALPLIFKIVGIWLKVREEGEDEGNKGMLSLPRIESVLYGAFVVMLACCVPVIDVSLQTLEFDISREKICGRWAPKAPDESGYAPVVSSLNHQTPAMPVWWVLVHKLSKGITQATVATIPCRPDLRQIRFEVQHTRIKNKALAQELQDFTNDCYSLALYQWKRDDQGQSTDESLLRDIEWIGSRTFLKDYYPDLQSKLPRKLFPWTESRDSGRPDTGDGGYPACNEWWSSADTGLKARVKAQADPDMWLRISAAFKMIGSIGTSDYQGYQEAVIRRMAGPQNLTVSQDGRAFMGYGANADVTITNGVTRLAGATANVFGSIQAFPALDSMRQALPMVQGILLMAIYIMLPLLLAFSGYEFKTVITLTFALFALNFLTFWWELARWLDSWMTTALYSSDTHSRFNSFNSYAGLLNSEDDVIMNFVMGTMFIVLPMVWVGALSWAGINIGQSVGSAISSGGSNVKKITEAGVQAVTSAIKAVTTKVK